MIDNLPQLMATIRLELGLAKGGRIKSVLLLFRLATYSYHGKSSWRLAFRPIAVLYKLYSEFLLGIELPAGTVIGSGLRLYHGVGLVVHKGARLGNDCTLRQSVTIGNKGGTGLDANVLPVIGNNVEFGAGSMVIGNVRVGNHVTLGAGVVVTKDIADHSVVVGQSPRILASK
jgi:putative colanic acid biosynthesis acetyltransferase WcaB